MVSSEELDQEHIYGLCKIFKRLKPILYDKSGNPISLTQPFNIILRHDNIEVLTKQGLYELDYIKLLKDLLARWDKKIEFREKRLMPLLESLCPEPLITLSVSFIVWYLIPIMKEVILIIGIVVATLLLLKKWFELREDPAYYYLEQGIIITPSDEIGAKPNTYKAKLIYEVLKQCLK
ncbi:MAG: hypothetical protein FGF52_06645 [Candidatus Brockarchaeota archaeon]|nr:hypothetical protein [Candidatus Brockarchaeota archaeon]